MSARWLLSLSCTFMLPELRLDEPKPPPTEEARSATNGSFCTIAATWFCSACMDEKEMSSRACVEIDTCPMSSVGRNPLLMFWNMNTVATTVPMNTSTTSGLALRQRSSMNP